MPELCDCGVGDSCCYVVVGGGAPAPSWLSAVDFLAGAESLAVLWVGALVRRTCAGRLGSLRHAFLIQGVLAQGWGAGRAVCGSDVCLFGRGLFVGLFRSHAFE